MYSNKENVNILTALLVAHGISDAVVCPGSRNAPIVHNLNECGTVRCVPVTDERSAGFVALGIALATGRPVVVCVTSGSALLNLAPAVAEAAYRHVPLVVVSADRPQAWIDQLDGQTLPQGDALGRFVRRAVSLPEPVDAVSRWHCNRLVNEALSFATLRLPAPVHINVPITEPLFDFTVAELPAERSFSHVALDDVPCRCRALEEAFERAERPMVVIGQMPPGVVGRRLIDRLSRRAVVISEPLGSDRGAMPADEVLYAIGDDAALMPDMTVYAGDTVVSKRVRGFLRRAGAPAYLLSADASQAADPTMSLAQVVDCGSLGGVSGVLESLASDGENQPQRQAYIDRWAALAALAEANRADFEPPFSQMAVVKYFEEQLDDYPADFHVHYANSSAVRLANIYAGHYVWCNRGVNGIEGSLSAAAGFSVAVPDVVFCVIGDLSFFYDQNALWNTSLHGNLRIVLLNNRCGGIFHILRGLEGSPARDSMVAAGHNADSRGICTQNDIGYLHAANMAEMQLGIVTLMTRQSARPMLLEVFTDADEDGRALQEYYRRLRRTIGESR